MPAYCSVPMISAEITLPATRMMSSSPKPASKTSSGGTRESLQPRMVAYGCCPFARSARISFCTVGKRASPRTNRSFPSMSRASAWSAVMATSGDGVDTDRLDPECRRAVAWRPIGFGNLHRVAVAHRGVVRRHDLHAGGEELVLNIGVQQSVGVDHVARIGR